MKNRYFAIVTFLALGLILTGGVASAEETQPGVGRISVVSGEVSTQRGDSGDWVATTVNAPVAPGDQVSTGAHSRTEIQLDYANILRLDQSTLAKVADLTRTRIQIQVAQGLVNFDVLKGSEAEAEIDTPSVAVRPLGEGRYRIEVDPNSSQTRVTVREGEVEVSTPQGSTRVKKGDLITIEGTDNPQYQTASAPGKDEWDNWNKDRDRTIEDAESWQHTNRYYAGTGDLDRYGHWEYVPGYDYVWAPYAAPGWVPYSAGNWVWEPYWGWTWVSYEPWGWAPYHYGRWFCWNNSWVWWPGPVYAAYRPVWAPAYVSFFGFGFGGGHWGFNFGFGFGSGFGFGASIGWLPIGPHDPFCPWYGRYGNSYNLVNVTNITNITNIRNIGTIPPLATARQPVMSNLNSVANNARVRQGLTTVPAVQFGRGSIAASRQAVTPEMLKQGQLVAGRLPVVPTRASLSPVKRPVNQAALPAHANANQHFFTKTAPPAGPTPFTQQAAQVRQMIQQRGASGAAERGNGATAPEASGARGAPATAARSQGNFSQGGMATPEAKAGSTSPSTGQGSNRSPNFGNESAGQFSRSGSSSRTPFYDNQALSRLPQSGFGRSGNQAASQKPQGSPSAQSGTLPGPSATSESRPGWRRFGDGSQPGVSAPNGRAQTPPTAERAQPRIAAPAPAQSSRPGWQSFAQGGQSRGSVSPQQGTSSHPGFQEPGGSRFPSRSETPSYGQPQRSFESQPGGERGFQRPSPSYSQPQGSYGRPLLQIRKPIVTERTPRSYNGGGSSGGYGGGSRGSYSGLSRASTMGGYQGGYSGASRGSYNGGYRGGAPSSSRGFSSSGSHSGGHGRR